ncbi:hypothetical protein ACQUYL_26460 [Pseudomonas paraeruginosa]
MTPPMEAAFSGMIVGSGEMMAEVWFVPELKMQSPSAELVQVPHSRASPATATRSGRGLWD